MEARGPAMAPRRIAVGRGPHRSMVMTSILIYNVKAWRIPIKSLGAEHWEVRSVGKRVDFVYRGSEGVC